MRSCIEVENRAAAPADLSINFRKALGARRGFAASHASSDRQPASTLSPSSPLNMVPRLRLSDRLAASAASRSALSPSSPVEVLTPQPNAAAAGVSERSGLSSQTYSQQINSARNRYFQPGALAQPSSAVPLSAPSANDAGLLTYADQVAQLSSNALSQSLSPRNLPPPPSRSRSIAPSDQSQQLTPPHDSTVPIARPPPSRSKSRDPGSRELPSSHSLSEHGIGMIPLSNPPPRSRSIAPSERSQQLPPPEDYAIPIARPPPSRSRSRAPIYLDPSTDPTPIASSASSPPPPQGPGRIGGRESGIAKAWSQFIVTGGSPKSQPSQKPK